MDNKAEYEEDTDESLVTKPTQKSLERHKGAYQKLRRDLSEEDLNNSGTQKLLLNDLDRLNEEVNSLSKFRNQFHEADKNNAVLQKQLDQTLSSEVLYAVSISLGATLIGLSVSFWTEDSNLGLIILLCGSLLVIGGIISKFLWK